MVINNTRPVIIAGFSSIMLIFMVLVSVWIGSQRYQHQQLVEMDTLRQAASDLGEMRKISLRRVLALHEMSLLRDVLDRDEKYQEFSELAGAFIAARENLLSLEHNRQALSLWEKIRAKVVASQQVQAQTLELLMSEQLEQGRAMLHQEVVPRQQQIMDALSDMFEHHNREVAQKFAKAERSQRNTYIVIFILALMALLISTGIIFYVVRTTSRIQNDLRRADEARIANQMKSDFLANMSHEIRTPLTAIIGYAEAALHPGQSRKERMDGINTIHSNGLHLLSLINEILDLSKVEAGKLEIEKMPVSVFEILQDIGDVANFRVQEKQLQYSLNYKFPLPAAIHTDPVRLKQILVNLVNNAIKFTEHGHVCVNVWGEPEQQKIYFAVEDTGIGITDEQCEKIFESFTQADRSITRKYGGTGLGLTLSRRLAGMLGGDIEVHSNPGQGSTFTVNVSTGAVEEQELVYHHEQASEAVQTFTAPDMPLFEGRVLLVEDVEANQKLISFFVTKTGAHVDVAENGQQALDMLQFAHYDLVFMDMQMPVMDGIEATRQIRERDMNVPIVMLTANVYAQDRRRCEQAGTDGFLSKPVSNQQINDILRRYLTPYGQSEDKVPIYSSLLESEPELQDIVSRFVYYLPKQIENLEGLHEQRDWDSLKDKVHDLKGTSGNMGFAQLYEHAMMLEESVLQSDYDAVARFLKELRAMVPRVNSGIGLKQEEA